MSTPDFETIKNNWETFERLCKKLEDEGVNNLLEALGERLVTAPAATHDSSPGCFPGGLIQNSLETTSKLKKAANLFDNLNTTSLLKVGLLHEIGKVGDLSNNLFVDQESDWHREKLGQNYKYNEVIPKATVHDRTLMILQHFGVKLTHDEFMAIRLSQGSHLEENKFYVGSEPDLAVALQIAKRV